MSLSVRPAARFTTLALIGGGEFSFGETREVDELLLARLPAGRRTIAFLPTASGSAEYAVHLGTYLRGIDPRIEVVNVPVYRKRDARRPKNLDAIRGAGMIYLGGGVAATLLATLRDSPAEAALREAAGAGAIVAAIGAAAACFGTYAADVRGGAPLPALGWLEATVIETAFEPAHDARMRRLMATPGITLGIGIPAKTALVVASGGETDIAGEGEIAVFRKAVS